MLKLNDDLKAYQQLLVPLATDSLILNAHGIHAIALTYLLNHNMLTTPCPALLTKEQIDKIKTYLKPGIIGLAGFEHHQQSLTIQLIEQLSNADFHVVQIYTHPHHIDQKIIICPLLEQTTHAQSSISDNVPFACDNQDLCKIINKNYLCSLFQTRLGYALYKTAQFFTFNNTHFLAHLPTKYSHLDPLLFQELIFYHEALSFVDIFKTHIMLINPKHLNLIENFKQFIAHQTTLPSTYLLALKAFLTYMISIRTPLIYPLSSMRFFTTATVGMGVDDINCPFTLKALKVCSFNNLILTQEQFNAFTHTNTQTKHTLAKNNILCTKTNYKTDIMFTPQKLLDFLNNTNNKKGAFFNYSQCLKKLLTNSKIDKLALIHQLQLDQKYKQILNQLEAFKKEYNITQIIQFHKSEYMKIGHLFLTYQAFGYTQEHNILIDISNSMPTQNEMALILQIYNFQNNHTYNHLAIITPSEFYTISSSKLEKKLDKIKKQIILV